MNKIDENKVREICALITERFENIHIRCFSGFSSPLFLISDAYPGVWLEHVYDSVFYAKMFPEKVFVAESTIDTFIANQKPNGQLPCYIIDPARISPDIQLLGYSQIQECVSFPALAYETVCMSSRKDRLRKVYESSVKWNNWLQDHRMTSRRGLIEMFVGYDTGHDNSGRLNGLSHRGGYCADAGILPPDDENLPILAVDMNCNFYAAKIALSKMAKALGLKEEAAKYRSEANEVKEKIFQYCYDKDENFFFDVDRSGNKRKYFSSSVIHLFLEGVLEPRDAFTERLYAQHIKNPNEFWTPFPIPSMAVNDPSTADHQDRNCWGYFSQGLIALRCTRWMDRYGKSDDLDHICEKWLEAWTEHFDMVKLGQELDPFTGIPSPSSEWYSSTMLFYLYSAKRFGIV